MRASLIYNPASGRGASKSKRIHRLMQQLDHEGIEASPLPTSSPGHATDLAREAVDRGVDVVLVWGGDGTLNETVWGMLGSFTPIGLLPGGSANVFARAAGIPRRLTKACGALKGYRPRSIPVGVVEGRPFLLMAGIGLDAEVVRRLGRGFKRRLGALAFWIRGLALLATYSYPTFTVRVDGRTHQATTAVAGKLRYYGGGYVITPEARLEEPQLHVVLFQGRGAVAYLRYLFGVLGGLHLRFRDVLHFHADRLEIESSSRVGYQLDGELAGQAPLTIAVRPDGIRMLLPV